MSSLRVSLAAVMVSCALASSCTRTQNIQSAPDPVAALQAIASPDPAQYEHITDMKTWRNPYLIVRADGVALYDFADNAEIILKPEEVIPALARLPARKWPYGRVVAAAEAGVQGPSEQDRIAIRRNKGIVGGLLADAHVTVRWVPSG